MFAERKSIHGLIEKSRKKLPTFAKKIASNGILSISAAAYLVAPNSVAAGFNMFSKISQPVSASSSFASAMGEAQAADQKDPVEELKKLIDLKTQDGVFADYTDPNGNKVTFSMDHIAVLSREAILRNEPRLVAVIPLKDYKKDVNTSLDKSYTEKLPDDIVTEEELSEKKGINIIKPDGLDVFIRESAFGPDGPLNRFNAGDLKSTFVFVDGPIISPDFMKDPRYAGVLQHIPKESQSQKLASYRADQVVNWANQLQDLRKLDVKPADYQDKLLSMQVQAFRYENLLSERQILEEASLSAGNAASGYYVESVNLFFVAVGESSSSSKYAVLYVDRNGNQKVEINSSYSYDCSPEPGQTRPNPADWIRNENADFSDPQKYIYGYNGPGAVLEHELSHFLLINSLNSNRSERDTDIMTANRLSFAWKDWTENGIDKNYNFIIKKGKVVILTRNLQEQKERALVTA